MLHRLGMVHQSKMFVLGCLFVACCYLFLLVSSEEVQATKEWTLLGANDTVDAGMHVRIDLMTGQKWVKLLESESETQSSRIISSSTAVSVHDATMDIHGESAIETLADDKNDPDRLYDYEMMHRLLSRLPDEEKARMELPEAPHSTMTTEQRLQFQQKMSKIWMERQEELIRLINEFVADLPQILRDRISRLEEYINDPHQQLLQTNITGLSSVNEDENRVTHIVSVLADLEYHLSDIDMTRDFYTLGGWPLLVSLLLDETHHYKSNGSSYEDGIDAKIHAVQTRAAWALGTAVKNTAEFVHYVTEPIRLLNRTTTALDVLLLQLSTVDLLDASDLVHSKLMKYLYALGSFLRGNPQAQIHFASRNGGSILERIIQSSISFRLDVDAKRLKLTQRLIQIVDDVVTESLHQGGDHAHAIVSSFASPGFCEAILRTIQISSLCQILAMQTAYTLAPFCGARQNWSSAVKDSSKELYRLVVEKTDDDDSSEIRRRAQSLLAIL